MKIGVDLKPFFTGSKFRGIGMYSRELLKSMQRQNTNDEFHFLNLYGEYENDPELDDNSYLHQYCTGPRIIDVGERQLINKNDGSEVIEAYVKHYIEKSDIDIMFFLSPAEYGNLYKIEWFENLFTVGILYDLIPLIFPKQCLYDKTYSDDYKNAIDFLKSMDLLLAISESAKQDAIRLLGVPEHKIKVIYAGINEEFCKLSSINVRAIKCKYKIQDEFILFAGGIDFKKNIEGLIEAYAQLDSSVKGRYQLVISGKLSEELREHYNAVINKFNLKDRVLVIGFIPTSDLVQLYNITALFAFPSLYEGFGLPVIEAMACGARVLTSKGSSLEEIAKNFAVLVNPKVTNSISKGMKYVFEHPVETLEMAERSIEYAKTFTWPQVAERAIKAIKRYNPTNINRDNKFDFEVNKTILEDLCRLCFKDKVQLSETEFRNLANDLHIVQEHKTGRVINGKNRLLYDMTVVREWLKQNYSTGIGRVSFQLYGALKSKGIVIPIGNIGTKSNPQYRKISMRNYEYIEEPIEFRTSDVYLMPELQLKGVQVPKDFYGVGYFKGKGIKCFAIIYDILPLQLPGYFEMKTVTAFKQYVIDCIKEYDGIIADSQSVMQDVYNYCNKHSPQNVKSVNWGFFHLGNDSLLQKEGSISPDVKNFFSDFCLTFLMVGTIEPRKGYELVLKVFKRLWSEGKKYKLCLIGHQGWKMENFTEILKKEPQYGKELIYWEGASDEALNYAYIHADALIQASAGEGFGLPLIEAGVYGLPIICSDIPVFHEVAENNAIYFKRDEDGLYEQIIDFEDKLSRGTIPNSSLIKKETWETAANKIYNMIIYNTGWKVE